MTTWSPTDKGAGITLSGDNLTAAVTSAALVRSTTSKTTGKHYFEIVRNSGPDAIIGVANASASLTNYLGSDANGWGYIGSNGKKLRSTSSTPYGAAYAAGVVIGVVLDATNNTIEFLRANVSQGVAFTGMTGPYFAAFGTANAGDTVTINFGAPAFTYAVPSGATAWDTTVAALTGVAAVAGLGTITTLITADVPLPNYAFLPSPYGVKFDDWASVAVEQLSAYAVPTPPDESLWPEWASYFSTGALPGSPPPEPYGFASWQEWAAALIGTQS